RGKGARRIRQGVEPTTGRRARSGRGTNIANPAGWRKLTTGSPARLFVVTLGRTVNNRPDYEPVLFAPARVEGREQAPDSLQGSSEMARCAGAADLGRVGRSAERGRAPQARIAKARSLPGRPAHGSLQRQELAEDVLQDASVLIVEHLLRRVDAH